MLLLMQYQPTNRYCSYNAIDTYYVTIDAQYRGKSATPKMHSLTAMPHIHIVPGKTQLNL